MADLKDRWLSLIDEYSVETTSTLVIELPTPTPTVIPIVPKTDIAEVQSADVATAPDDSLPSLPIYEATPAQINYWHGHGSSVFLQSLLRKYQLDNSSPNVAAYNHFKIGLDTKRHRAIFALDDNHYLAIEFNQWNSAPLDKTQARLVLEKICAIRIATRRFKTFCGVQIEYFD